MNETIKIAGVGKGTKKICLLSDHHLCINPRLWKEAFFYEKQGFEVVILTMWQSKNLLQKDWKILKGHAINYTAYLNGIPGEINTITRFFYRLRKRLAGELQRFLKIGSAWAISYAPELMQKKALSENADLYAAHLECAFYVGRELVKAGKKVSFDFEDWYSRDYLVPERPVQILASLERLALQEGLFCTAASGAMAAALAEKYQPVQKITVIYNGFSELEKAGKNEATKPMTGEGPIKLLWFSRTIGPDRGIAHLLQALSACDLPVELHLLGEMAPGYHEILEGAFPYHKGHLLNIHAFIPHDQLLPFIAQFKIGLAIEEKVNDNRQLTITNKILQYVQAGLLVIASDTPGQREVAAYLPGSVCIVDINQPGEVAEAIKRLHNQEPVDEQSAFKKIFSWEAQENKLTDLIGKYL